jgi:uncharacterized protein YoxC
MIEKLPEIMTGVGTFLGSTLAAYLVVRSRNKVMEDVEKELKKPEGTGEGSLRESVEKILEKTSALQQDLAGVKGEVGNVRGDVKLVRVDSQMFSERVHLIERDILELLKRKE